jgi:hypothetical protein
VNESTRAATLGVSLGLALIVSACGAGAGPNVEKTTPMTVDRLYPLRQGSVWTYDVDTGDGVPVLAITRVLSSTPQRIEVSSGGDPLIYELRPDGLLRTDLDSYVLHTPLTQGASWEQPEGARAEITDVAKSVTTVAGDFRACVEVLEQGGPGSKHVRTVFCPDVGPVEIESSLSIALTGKTTRVVARLRGYDFSGALAAP